MKEKTVIPTINVLTSLRKVLMETKNALRQHKKSVMKEKTVIPTKNALTSLKEGKRGKVTKKATVRTVHLTIRHWKQPLRRLIKLIFQTRGN